MANVDFVVANRWPPTFSCTIAGPLDVLASGTLSPVAGLRARVVIGPRGVRALHRADVGQVRAHCRMAATGWLRLASIGALRPDRDSARE